MFKTQVLILYVSDICNLNCSYCIWPKEKEVMISKNKHIREFIENGRYFENIRKNVDTSYIKQLDLWGGEPTMNFDIFIPALKKHLNMFSSLETLSFSTNISKHFTLSNIIKFIEKFAPYYKLDIQLSLDGPPFINDEDRLGSSSKEISENIFEFSKFLQNFKYNNNVHTDIKSTISARSMHKLADESNLYDYFSFFDSCWDKCQTPFAMSFVFPGDYSQENGFEYAKITNNLLYKWPKKGIKFKHIRIPYEDQNVLHIARTLEAIMRFKRRIYSGEFIATSVCSVGDRRIAIDVDGNFRICHGVFFFYDELKSQHDMYMNYLKHNVIATSKMDKLRLLHNSVGIHNNVEFRIAYHQALATELVLSGQISRIYLKNKALLNMLAFVTSRHHCISDNITYTGDMMLIDASYLKLLGNGAFELISKYLGSKYDI